jgi:hypothetical protein
MTNFPPYRPRPKQRIWPVSVRFLVPEIEEAIGVDGLVIDVLYQCYRTSANINGRSVPCEYYFTTCTTGVQFTWPVPVPWDLPWGDRGFPRDHVCQGYDYEPTKGKTPCAYACQGPKNLPIPEDWEYPAISAGGTTGDDDTLAYSDDDDAWWY